MLGLLMNSLLNIQVTNHAALFTDEVNPGKRHSPLIEFLNTNYHTAGAKDEQSRGGGRRGGFSNLKCVFHGAVYLILIFYT